MNTNELRAGLLIPAVALGAIACSAHNATTTASDAGTLAAAQHPQCTPVGPRVAHYLATGDNGGHPELDNAYAQDLRIILNSPQASRNALIRLDANDATTACDKQADAEAAAQAQAAQERQQAAEQAQAEAAKTVLLAKEKTTCIKLGAEWSSGLFAASDGDCSISYQDSVGGPSYPHTVYFDSSGNVTPAPDGPRDAASCASFDLGVPGHWHPDTDICTS